MKKPGRARRRNSGAAEATAGAWPERLQAASLWGAVALVVAAPLVPCESAATLGSHVIIAMGWLLVLATWAAGSLLSAHPRLHLGPAGMVVIAFVLVHSISAIVMGNEGHARPALNMLWQYVGYGVSFLVLRQVARGEVAVRAVCSALIGLAFGLATLGFYQYFISMPADVAAFEKDPDEALRRAGINAPEGSPERRQFTDRVRSTEPTATFALANSLAGFLTPCLVLVAGLAGWDRLRERAWRSFVGAMLIAGPLAGCLLLTKSRSAFVGVSFGVLAMAGWQFLRQRLPRWRMLIGGVSGLGGLLLLATWLGGLDREVVTEAPKSLLFRLQYWRATIGMVGDFPGLGCGPGNFKEYYTRYKLPEASETITDPHNFLLEVAATAGLPALVVFACIGVAVTFQLRRNRLRQAGRCQDHTLQYSPAVVYAGLAAGILVAVPVGAISGFPVNLPVLLLCLPASGLAIWLLHPWVSGGSLSTGLLLIALGALLVNLLAAGGIGYPGIGQLVWVLLAMVINLDEVSPAGSHAAAHAPDNAAVAHTAGGTGPPNGARRKPSALAGNSWPPFGRRAVAVTLVLTLVLLATCFATGYRPVLAAHRYIASAMSSRDWRAANDAVQSAALVDPWWAEPWELLADLAFQHWQSNPSSSTSQTVQQYALAALTLDPQSSRLHRRHGDWLLEMFLQSGESGMAQQAAAAYRQATQLYPNSSILHAQLAWVLHLSGQDRAAAEEAAEALRLNELTPHQEHWLQNQRLVGSPPPEVTSLRSPTAEQLMLKLRKSNKSG